jgi:hypothetical protein
MNYKEYTQIMAKQKRSQETWCTVVFTVGIVIYFVGRILWS